MPDKMTEKDAREAALTARGLFDVTEDDSVYHLAKREFEAGWHSARQFYQPKWVRIEDGLPEADGYYLCQIDPKFGSDGVVREFFFTETKRFHNTHITAWMPIPGYQPEEKQP